jgi:AraC family transcriptional regulator, regulatory protein of adaptative response / DNA-3-methyladenine glycosylase II
MKLDQDQCYRALKSRDARFDGQFFTAVLTTGIYCRPVCPAPTPRRANVRFYACAAAAQAAGFRPCLRCRPETSPGAPAWQGTSATVSRGLRLIDEGAMDEGGVDELAARLGIGSRHLRRLFMEHLGVTPVAVAQTRRVHFAKKLIDETRLSMADIAFSAGFSSIRRFNSAFRTIYGRAPRELRRQGSEAAELPAEAPLRLRMTYRPPFDWESLLAYFGDRATAGVESVEPGVYRRAIAVGEAVGAIEVTHQPDRHALILRMDLPDARSMQQVTGRARRLFDLEANPAEIVAVLERDSILRSWVRRFPGLRVPGAWDSFETAVRIILGQQISVKAATTLAGRIAEAYGRPFRSAAFPELTRLPPRPRDLVDADLTRLGVVSARARAIQGLARAVAEGRIRLEGGTEPERAIRELEALPGLGPWSAQLIAMRALREPDAFPASDLGLLRGLAAGGAKPTPAALLSRAEAWRPWRAYAAVHLWNRDRVMGGRRSVAVAKRKKNDLEGSVCGR